MQQRHRAIPAPVQHLDERRGREHHHRTIRPRSRQVIPGGRPPEELISQHEERFPRDGDERPVRQCVGQRLVASLAVPAGDPRGDALLSLREEAEPPQARGGVSRIRFSRSRSFVFALRIALVIIGAAMREKPLGSPRLRRPIVVPPSAVSSQV